MSGALRVELRGPHFSIALPAPLDTRPAALAPGVPTPLRPFLERM